MSGWGGDTQRQQLPAFSSTMTLTFDLFTSFSSHDVSISRRLLLNDLRALWPVCARRRRSDCRRLTGVDVTTCRKPLTWPTIHRHLTTTYQWRVRTLLCGTPWPSKYPRRRRRRRRGAAERLLRVVVWKTEEDVVIDGAFPQVFTGAVSR